LLIKTEGIENVVVDEANQRTYVIMAGRTLTDGELYRIIRLELLGRGHPLAGGERLVISASKWDKSCQGPKGGTAAVN
jgi:hypothetical protein